MLTKVVILIQQSILPALQHLSVDLNARGVDMVTIADLYDCSRCSTRKDTHEKADELSHDSCDESEHSTLYITDSETAYHALHRRGKYVLPYRHEGNRDSDFAGALYVIEQIEEIDYETIDMVYCRLAGFPWQILMTERCIIRETTVEDVDSFYQIYAEPEITRYMEDLYADRDEEIAYIRDYQEKVYGFYGYGMWTVLTKAGTVIGRAGFSWREGFDLPELGFVIGVPWQRQGYAYEVCRAVLDYARKELGFDRVQALVMQGNDKSELLCKKLGFQYQEEVTEKDCIYRRMICVV